MQAVDDAATDGAEAAGDVATTAGETAEEALEGAADTGSDAVTDTAADGAEAATDAVTDAVTDTAPEAPAPLTVKNFDLDAAAQMIDSSDVNAMQKTLLKATLQKTQDNPELLKAALEQVRAALGM
jgi:hypothetical protein